MATPISSARYARACRARRCRRTRDCATSRSGSSSATSARFRIAARRPAAARGAMVPEGDVAAGEALFYGKAGMRELPRDQRARRRDGSRSVERRPARGGGDSPEDCRRRTIRCLPRLARAAAAAAVARRRRSRSSRRCPTAARFAACGAMKTCTPRRSSTRPDGFTC